MINNNLYYIIYKIYENSQYSLKNTITLRTGCSKLGNPKLTFINETEEFIISVLASCQFEGIYKNYIFIYSYNKESENNINFLGVIRPFTFSDPNYCCDYNINFRWENVYSFLFSPVIEKYLIIIGTGNNYISLFILDKEIKIVNQQNELELFSFLIFICEDYDNYYNFKCSKTLLKEIEDLNFFNKLY